MSELIDSIYDVSAIKKEADEVFAIAESTKSLIQSIRGAKDMDSLAKSSKAVNENMVNGQKALDSFTAAIKELENQQKALLSTQSKSNTLKTQANEELIKSKKQLAEETELLKQNTILNDKNAGSLEKAVALNKKLQAEKMKLDLTTKEGIDRLKEINDQQDKNNELIKSGANAMQQQKANVGNYSSGVRGLMDQLKNGEIGLGGFTKGIWGMTKAFMASPIGWIALAVAGLVAIFKDFKPVIDKIEQSLAAMGAAFQVVKNVFSGFLSGNKNLKESFQGLGETMKEAAMAAAQLKKAEQDLEETQLQNEIANKRTETQMQKLILQSKNKTLTEKESMALLDEAMRLEQENHDRKKAQNEEEIRIAFEKMTIGKQLSEEDKKRLKEDGIAYAFELQNKVQISDDEIAAYKDALLRKEDIEQESIALVEKSNNKLDALAEKQQAKAEKAAEKAEKEAEKKKAQEEKAFEGKRKLIDSELALMEEGQAKQIAISDEAFKRTLEDLKTNGQLTDELEKNLKTAHEIELQKIKDDFAKQAKEKEAADLEKKLADFEKNMQKEAELLQAGFRGKETELKKEYAAGKLSREQYEEALVELQASSLKEANDATIKSLQKELEIADLSSDKRAEISAKLRDLQIQNENAALDATIESNNKKIEADKAAVDKRKEIATQIVDAGMELFGAINDYQAQQSENRLAEIEKEQAASDAYFERRQENLDNSIMSDENRASIQKQLDEEKAKRDAELLKKQQAEKTKQAKWEKSQALVSAFVGTANAVVGALGSKPWGVWNFIFAALAGAAGAVQIAKIASQQIPTYATGTDNHPGGISIWGEARPEVAVTPAGEIMYAERPTVTNFDAGTKIFKSVEDYERNYTASKVGGKPFEFDYDKMAASMPRDSFELNGNGSWTMINKSNDRRTVINRRYKTGS